MDGTSFFPDGCRWLRADFHLHTRRDREFSYTGEDGRFITDYVAALKKVEIKLAVVTNHNKFDLEEFKALRKAARREGIYLLPGVELSVGDGANGIHTLVIFQEDWIDNKENVDFIERFLHSTFLDRTNYETDNGRSNHGLLETFKLLDGFAKDYFVIFAHVEEKSGLWEEIDSGRLQELGQKESFRERVLGFQKVRTHARRLNTQSYLKDSYPAEVEGSDPKCLDDVGKGEEKSYIKLGDFNFTAVKYALRDHLYRVANEIPKTEHSHIQAIRFEGGLLDGQQINFNSGLNCLIGIRGSGKSAILEAIRYTLSIPFGVKAQDKEYKERLLQHALGSGGNAIITASDFHGEIFEIRRILGESPDVYLNGERKLGVHILSTILNKPIYFGQKDLASTGEGFERDLVEKLVGGKLEEIRSAIERQKSVILETVYKLDKLKNLDEQIKEWNNKKNDAMLRLEFFQKHGVEDKLRRQVDFDSDIAMCKQIVDVVNRFITAGNDFIAENENTLENLRRYESRENASFFEEMFITLEKIIISMQEFKNSHQTNHQHQTTLVSMLKNLISRREELKDEFATVERELSQQLRSETDVQNIHLDDFIQLNKTINQAGLMLTELEKGRKNLESLRAELSKSLKDLNDLWHQEFKIIQKELEQINTTQESLQIKIEFKEDKEEFNKCLKTYFRGSNLREPLFESIVQEFPDFIDIFENLEKEKLTALVGTKVTVFQEYFHRNLASLVTWQPPNRYSIEYHKKELKHHSLGQRASALILFILSQKDNDIIIIDQPEDDLDNQTIYEDVIKIIRKLKSKVQFLFATHNANFPVLGDAEQIISCSFSDERIATHSGSIDQQETQKRIVDIMEGGKEAFMRRKEIYLLWKQ